MTERCWQCGQGIPEGFEFCGKCGARLGTHTPPFLKDSRERKLLENDIAEAVTDRLIKWGKRVGTVFVSAMTILVLSLSIWGITSYSGLKSNLQEIANRAKATAKGLKTNVDSSVTEVENLRKQYKELNSDLEHYRQVNHSIEHLQQSLNTVNGQIANWYGSLESEVFDSSNASKVQFIALSAKEKEALSPSAPILAPSFRAVITLKKAPIPASVRITRYNLTIPPAEMKVAGRQVSFITPSDELSGSEGPPIYVQYHPAP